VLGISGCLVFASGVAILADPALVAVHVDNLIRRLGSEIYAERKAAAKNLEVVGELALTRLREAAAESDDAEIRYRAQGLVNLLEDRILEKQINAIRYSHLSAKEKGRQLRAFLKVGMATERVYAVLGPCQYTIKWGTRGQAFYPNYGLIVDCNYEGSVISIGQLAEK
jgi:hypothetical protein